jgi:hypothetical protein
LDDNPASVATFAAFSTDLAQISVWCWLSSIDSCGAARLTSLKSRYGGLLASGGLFLLVIAQQADPSVGVGEPGGRASSSKHSRAIQTDGLLEPFEKRTGSFGADLNNHTRDLTRLIEAYAEGPICPHAAERGPPRAKVLAARGRIAERIEFLPNGALCERKSHATQKAASRRLLVLFAISLPIGA